MVEVGRQPFNILKSTQLGSVTQSQFNDIQKGTFVEDSKIVKKNWDHQVTIKNAQLATKTFGYGLPDPGSLAIIAANADSTGNIAQPASGEVWQVINISLQESEGATAGANLALYDGSSSSYIWFDASVSANSVKIIEFPGTLYLTNDVYLRLTIGSGGVELCSHIFKGGVLKWQN